MDKTPTRFLNLYIFAVTLLCVLVFVAQAALSSSMGASAIHEMGVFYISGISEQVASHFGTTIELRLSQVESLVYSVPPSRATDPDALKVSLTYNARFSGFEYLAFYTEEGEFQMIYGSQVQADVPEALRRSVQGGKYNVCAGKDGAGTPVALMGVPVDYPLGDGRSSMALVAGLPTSYLQETLENNIHSSIMEYYIVRDDGSIVLHNGPIEDATYFDRIARLYEPTGGRGPEDFSRELRASLENDTDYASEAVISGERWNIYCTRLPNSEWHLLLKSSRNMLDDTVDRLQGRWTFVSVGGCCLIIGALMLVFVRYYKLSKHQMRSLDEARRAAERSNQAKNEFLSNMSHDIRTPMNGIMGMTTVAISSLDDPPRVRSCLKRIHVSSRHLLGLINDMLDMSKIGTGELTLNIEPLSLREIMQNIETVIRPQVQEKMQSFHIYIHGVRHENVCSDRVRLSQILLNMIGNAVKFTPEGGSIVVALYEEPSPKGEGYIRSRLQVIDNGIGISKEFQSQVFEAFAREDRARVDKTAGSGMGLAITRHIVEAMEGTIGVESEQGKGSCFTIVVDMEKAIGQEKELLLPHHRVLLLEEDPTEGQLAVEDLRSIGLEARVAGDTATAKAMLRDFPAHALLLSASMEGAGSPRAARELREESGLPVILLTDGQWDELDMPQKEEGFDGVIAKPLFRSGLYYGLRPFMEEEAHLEEQARAHRSLEGLRVLLAEDNHLNAEIACELLGDEGLEMEWAEDGGACLEKFKASAPGWYDAILMDLRMPVMTGLEAARAIRALPREDALRVPIIAVSADAFEDDIQKCLEAGMNAHTAKPLDPDKVLALLGESLGR